jgi:hypothetical protein
MRDVLLQPVPGGVGSLWHVNAPDRMLMAFKDAICNDHSPIAQLTAQSSQQVQCPASHQHL